MSHSFIAMNFRYFLISVIGLTLSACGGTKILREPVPMTFDQPVTTAEDGRISVALDGVIVRDGPGTWARNADWDEYLVSVRNLTTAPLTISEVGIVDSSQTRQLPNSDRRALVRESRQTARRYADSDLEVRAGYGGGALMAAGVVGGAAAVGAGSAALYMSSAAAATTVGVLLAAPALVAGGVAKTINQGRVSDEIVRRHVVLPFVLAPEETIGMDLFFPLSPSPQRLEIIYQVEGEAEFYSLPVDTSQVLNGLHLSSE